MTIFLIDGQITELDFINACYCDPLLLQSIGPCLPPARSLAVFMAIFIENYRSYSTEWNGKLIIKIYTLNSNVILILDEWKEQQRIRMELGEINSLESSNSREIKSIGHSSTPSVGHSQKSNSKGYKKGRKSRK
jgi:hypothetical protein